MARYKMVMDMGRNIDSIEFSDYVDRIFFMDEEDRVKSLVYGLRNRDPWRINAHAAQFQTFPHNMELQYSLGVTTVLIEDWLDNYTWPKDKSNSQHCIAFICDVLTEIYD